MPRLEDRNPATTVYHDVPLIETGVAEGRHREIVGGLWDEIGALQFAFLRDSGLAPDQRLLDLGCGCLRGGVHFVRYLDAGNYYGIDVNQSLLDAGRAAELRPAGLADRLPDGNLACRGDFDATGFGVAFDAVLAMSLFTHLPSPHLRACLERLLPVTGAGAKFFCTVFLVPDDQPFSEPCEQAPAIVTTATADPYHYRLADLRHACEGLPWRLRVIGDWGHPRNQQMVVFERPADGAAAAPGDADYRAFVGPPERYDAMGASQFALLHAMGLRDHHRVLDFGCGSLRLGRLLIPWLRPERYFAIEPEGWLIDAGFSEELGEDIRALKRPAFDGNADFDCTVFDVKFDFVMAQSILTHCGPDLFARFLDQLEKVLEPDGVALFSWIEDSSDGAAEAPAPGWHYPHCVAYPKKAVLDMVRATGLHGTSLPWRHPDAAWFAVARRAERLPDAEQKRALRGDLPGDAMAVRRAPSARVRFADYETAAAAARSADIATARLVDPADGTIAAGETGRLVFEIAAGAATIGTGGRIRLCFHHICTWSAAQTTDPDRAGYVTAVSSNGAPLRVAAWGDVAPPADAMRRHFPWQHAIEIAVGAPGLYEGDRVTVTYGAGPARASLQVFEGAETPFRVLIDPQGTGTLVPAASQPAVSVIGGEAARLVIVVPTDCRADDPAGGRMLVRAEDAYGNLARGYAGTVTVEMPPEALDGPPPRHTFDPGRPAVHWFTGLKMTPAGPGRAVARDENGLAALSNPFRVRASGDGPPPVLWGEIHAHTLASDGQGTAEAFYRYARDVAALDVAATTEHDFMLTDRAWAAGKRATEAACEDGRFVTLQAYEWSGMTDVGGDRNVYFRDGDPPICRSRTLYDYRNPFIYHGPDRAANHVEDLYRWLDEEVGEGEVVVAPQWGGRPANPQWADPRYDRLVELFSEHRRVEDWADGFRAQGVRLGFVGGGDDHICRPGNGFLTYGPTPPEAIGGSGKGLVAILAEPTREDVFDALYARRTYATTGARILIDARIAGRLPGADAVSDAPTVDATIFGTAEIDRVEIRRDNEVVHVARPAADPSALAVGWTDPAPPPSPPGGTAYNLRVVQKDGHLAVTSPVWVRAPDPSAG